MQITPQQLLLIFPRAGKAAGGFVDALNLAMARYHIDSPVRAAAFLAQIGHESGQLHWVREIWGPTPAQVRYEGRQDLGNVQPGDGKRYMGRGLIQVTGRANYQKAGAALGLPLVEQPELLEQPETAALSAGWFWQSKGLNELADQGSFELITKRINGGLNGQAERVALWETAKRVLA